VQALSRIGGFVALIKLVGIFMYLIHWQLFENKLSKMNKKMSLTFGDLSLKNQNGAASQDHDIINSEDNIDEPCQI
jgi:hypothetical protein